MINFDGIEFKETKYVGYYVSQCGKIISVKIKGAQGKIDVDSPRYHAIKIDKDGYCEVCISLVLDGKHKRIYRRLHRLIYETWIGDIEGTIDHIDDNKQNNNICNLRDISRQDNSKYRPSLKPRIFDVYINGNKTRIQVRFMHELASYVGLSDSALRGYINECKYSKKLNCRLKIIEL